MAEIGELDELKALGELMDSRFTLLDGRTTAVHLAETLLRIRGRDGRLVSLQPNAVQQMFEVNRGRTNIVLKARQMGLSTWIAGRFFLKTILQPGTLTVQVAHTQRAAQDLFCMVHRFQACLPQSLRRGVLKTLRANVSSLVYPSIDSEYRVQTAGDPNAGRGLTIQNLHCSEVSRWPGDAAETLAGLRAALAPGGEIVLESTANGAYGCFYDEWAHAQETGLTRHFYPWWLEPAYVMASVDVGVLDEAERWLMEKHALSLGQMAFRRDLRAKFGRLVMQEYPENAEECFLASGACVFDMEAVGRRLLLQPDPIEQRWNGGLQVWYPPVAGKQYLVAVDPSGGGMAGDYCAMQIIERSTGLQCAEFRGRAGLLEIAGIAAELAGEYNRALLVVERNNHGHAVLAYLRSSCPYERIFSIDGEPGWLTTSLTRPAMLECFVRVLHEHPEVINSGRLLEECRTFVRDGGGRMAAAAGAHDDCLMAMSMALHTNGVIAERW